MEPASVSNPFSASSGRPDDPAIRFESVQRQLADALTSGLDVPVATDSESARSLALNSLGDAGLDISIELGRTEVRIEEILNLRSGSVVALDKLAGDPVDILANGRLVARGELQVADGKFSVRLREVL